MAKSSNGISIANVLALAGLAGIGVITFFGVYLRSGDGKPGGAIICAAALVAGLGFLLFLSMKAKAAEDNPDKWRWVEYSSLVVYIVVAYLCASPFLRFFYVLSEKDMLQNQARKELQAIENMYAKYDKDQKDYLTNATQQIKNCIDAGQKLDYIEDRVGRNVDSWREKANAIVKLQKDVKLAEIKTSIEQWSIMHLSELALDLTEKETSAWTAVQNKIKEYGEKNNLIPVISGGDGRPYRYDGFAQFDLGERPEAKFSKDLREANGSTPLGWIIYVILNLLVILNYLVVNRSVFVGPTDFDGNGGGTDL